MIRGLRLSAGLRESARVLLNMLDRLLALQAARAREMVKDGLIARPTSTAVCASFNRPSCATPADNKKLWVRIIAVGLDRPPKPRSRLLPTAQVEFGKARIDHPEVSHCIARTEAQRLNNMSL